MLKYTQDNREDYLGFLKKLVSIKSLPCEEKEVAEFILGELKKIENISDAFIDGAGNVIGVIKGKGEGPSILFDGHMDVVPEGNLEYWKPFEPYNPVIHEGRMYGRGVADMKTGLAAQFYAFKAIAQYLQKTGEKLSGDLIYTGVVQEEPAEMFGMGYLIEHTLPEHDLKCDAVFLSEPTYGRIMLGSRGKIELSVKTYGKAAHSSTPDAGINALLMMAPVLQAIADGEGINLDPDPYLGETCITVTNCTVKPGGNLSTVPDECEIAIDRRFSTAMSEEDLLGEFEAIFAKAKEKNPDFQATVEPRYFEETSWTGMTKKVKKWHPAWRIGSENVYAQKTFKALEKIGLKVEVDYSKPGNDGSMTCGLHGIPTIMYCPADGDFCHQEKESVSVKEIEDALDAYISILTEIYGIDLKEFDE